MVEYDAGKAVLAPAADAEKEMARDKRVCQLALSFEKKWRRLS